MTKFTKFLAAVVAASAVLSLAGCGNKENSESASGNSSVADSSAAADSSASSEFDITKMYGIWALAGINDGTNTMTVTEYADSLGADAESCMMFVTIDENSYTSSSSAGDTTCAYTATDSGLTFNADGVDFTVYYDEGTDSIAYGVALNDVTYKYIFMRYTDEAAATATAEAAGTVQASATAEVAE